MQQALALARQGEGLTRPNPPVGAVWVKAGKPIGQGWHRQAGGPHAEVGALRAADQGVRGGTLYVTLEPCSTTRRTPPCTDAILRAAVRKVVVGTRDPNPLHRGRGLRLLRRHGIEVVEGVCARDAAALIAPFHTWVSRGRPYVTLKLGMTLDGRIADRHGASRWITGPEARAAVQALRRRADAILVGWGTVRADNPRLVPRPAYQRKPLRVIVAGRRPLPSTAHVFRDALAARTVVAAPSGFPESRRRRIQKRGASVVRFSSRGTRVPLDALMNYLGQQDILHVVAEGGAEIAASLIRERLVDEYVVFVAPSVLGGRDTLPAVAGKGWLLNRQPQLTFVEATTVGTNLMIRARPRAPARA